MKWFFAGDSQPRKVVKEDDLKSYEKEDNYKRKRWVLHAITIVSVVAISAMPVILLIAMIVDDDVRTRVVNLLVQNIPSLLVAGLVLTGVKILGNK